MNCSSFSNWYKLSQSKPYGYWLLSDGELIEVKDIIEEGHSSYLESIGLNNSDYIEAYSLGMIRIVMPGNSHFYPVMWIDFKNVNSVQHSILEKLIYQNYKNHYHKGSNKCTYKIYKLNKLICDTKDPKEAIASLY